LLQQSASGLGIDQNLQRHRAVSLRQHGFLVKVSNYFPKIVENCELDGLFTLPSDDVIFGQNPNIQLVCAVSAIKLNIWDIVSIVLTLIIMSSDEIDSLGVFTVGFKPLQAYIMSLWHQMPVARMQPVR